MSLSRADAAHLLRRTGFAALPDEIDRLAGTSRQAAVTAVVDRPDAVPKAPAGVGDTSRTWWDRYVTMSHHWYGRMATTANPLAEKLTLFWHGVLTSSVRGSDHVSMLDQNLLLRRLGLGHFADLVNAVAVSPAMLQYLSNDRNVKNRPNENFGRELLELFTMGVGTYTQDDVIASSRAWTGHGLHRPSQGAPPVYRFHADRHDAGPKTFLGRTAHYDGPDLVREIVTGAGSHASSRHVARRLWSFLAYPNPEPAIVDAVADAYVAGGYRVRELVRAILRHDAFWSERARTGLLRSPVELHVAAMRHLGLAASTYHPEWYDAAMGQQLFEPPNVAGWPGGASWVSTSATWAWDDAASHAMWKANEARSLPETRALSPADAVTTACAHIGIARVSAPTRQTMQQLVTTFRSRRHWGEPQALMVLALLSPEFRLA